MEVIAFHPECANAWLNMVGRIVKNVCYDLFFELRIRSLSAYIGLQPNGFLYYLKQ